MSLPVNPPLKMLMASALVAVGLMSIPQPASADDGSLATARRARDILAQRCFQCHGSNGAARKNVFVLDRDRLISSKTVVPGDPNSLLLEMVESNAMPLGGPYLSEEEKNALRKWVLDGAPGWDAPTKSPRAFLSESKILTFIQSDLMKADERDRPYLRYFSFAHLYNASVIESELESYRVALAKLVNSLSWHPEIMSPFPVDPAKTLFRIDLRDYNWTAANWDRLMTAYPYGLRARGAEIITLLSGPALPYIRADWFVANASAPPLYHDLLGLPETVEHLERMLGVDTFRNLREEKNVARAGVRNSGVSHNNRVLERHVSAYGAYWKSYDFRSNLADQNIFKDPLRLNAAGGEIIFNLPNGLQAYLLVDGRGRRINEAPIDIVADRNNADDPVIRNGRSCMSCHYSGMQSFKDDVRPVLKELVAASFDIERALALYADQETLDRLIEKDRDRFQRAVAQVGGSHGLTLDTEPVNALSRRFIAEMTSVQAAAEAGMELEEFKARVSRSRRLMALGFGQLLVSSGGFKRDAWENGFGLLVRELQLGDYISNPGSFSGRALGINHNAAQQRIVSGNFNPSPSRTPLISAEPAAIMRSARTVFVHSNSIFLKQDKLEKELRKRSEFRELGLIIVRDEKMADLRIQIDRPPFTFIYEFALTNPETSILLTSGKVTAFDGSFAAPKIAKEILKRLQAARSPSSLSPKR